MTPARDALSRECRRLPGTSLDEVLAMADLQTRVDRKYLVPGTAFAELVAVLGAELHILDIGGRRLFDYESVYFDTPGLLAFHQHAGGRRRRFKVRTRTYLDSGSTTLELKTEGIRGQTVKDRHPYALADRYELTPPGRRVVADGIGSRQVASALQTSLVNRYIRATLVDASTSSRMTCDVDLAFSDRNRRRTGPDDLIVLESKTAGAAAPADKVLWRLGHRPVSVSKYCVGLTLLHPHLPANRWNRVLRRQFGWSPDRADQLLGQVA